MMHVRLRRGLVAAGIAGVLAGGVTAVATRGSFPSAGHAGAVPALRPERGPLRTALPQTLPPRAGAAPVRPTYPPILGTRPRVVARVADPFGGPPWAIRLFDRRAARTAGQPDTRGVRVVCAQVGRIVAGEFVWIDPRRPRALRVPVRVTDTTVCTGRGRTASVAALRVPIGDADTALPGIAATVFWGVAPGARTVTVGRGARRVVLPDLAGGSRLVVTRGDFPVGSAEVVADGRAERRGLANGRYVAEPSRIVAGALRHLVPATHEQRPIRQIERNEGFTLAAVVADPAADRPALVVTSRIPGSEARCWGMVSGMVGGEPVRPASGLGVLIAAGGLCEVPTPARAGTYRGANNGASSGGARPAAEQRRAVQRRILPGASRSVIVVPANIVEVDLREPTGVRTVRTVPVGRTRLAVSLTAGDLPLGGWSRFGGWSRPRRSLVGRDVSGRAVELRPVG